MYLYHFSGLKLGILTAVFLSFRESHKGNSEQYRKYGYKWLLPRFFHLINILITRLY